MSVLDRWFYSMTNKPTMDDAQRASLALSSMYSILDGRADDSLAGNSFWIKQGSWNMLAGGWGIEGRTIAHKHDKALEVLAWLQAEGSRMKSAGAAAPADLLAWDIARLVHVARRCRHAGFLDEAEAWKHVLAAGRLARPSFMGWKEYGAAFLRGREVWAGGPDERVAAVVGELEDDEASMWRTTPWEALPR